MLLNSVKVSKNCDMYLKHLCTLEIGPRSQWSESSCWRTGQKILWSEKQKRWATEWKKVSNLLSLYILIYACKNTCKFPYF